MRKRKVKNFQKLGIRVDDLERSVQSEQIEPDSASRGNVYQETDQEKGISGNNGTCLDNPAEEVIFESNQSKEQHETMKL